MSISGPEGVPALLAKLSTRVIPLWPNPLRIDIINNATAAQWLPSSVVSAGNMPETRPQSSITLWYTHSTRCVKSAALKPVRGEHGEISPIDRAVADQVNTPCHAT